MSLTAGAVTVGTVTATSVQISVGAATSGTAPYAYQWYRSTTSGFTPGGGNIVSGATALSLSDSGLVPGTTYYYKNVVTDSASPTPATATASSSVVSTSLQTPNQNQFAQLSQLGMVDMPYSFNTHPAQIDLTQSGTLYPGQPVKLVANSNGGVPKVVACAANSDEVFGFINYDVKNIGWVAGQAVELSLKGNIMYLYATAAITQGAQLELDLATVGGVKTYATSGAKLVGWAYDGAAAAGALIRVYLEVPSFTAHA